MSNLYRSANSTQAAMFSEIGVVARQEKRRLLGGDDEPPEVTQMRIHAALEAKAMLATAVAEADALREHARLEGFEQGLVEGRISGHQEVCRLAAQERTQARAEMAAFVQQLEAERKRVWGEAEAEIIAFVLEVAHKVIKDEAKVNRDVALSVIRNALRRVVDGDHIRVRVNIDDLEAVRSAREELLAVLDGLPGIEIVDDRRVGVGGCVIETASGTIDAKIETQLSEIAGALRLDLEQAA